MYLLHLRVGDLLGLLPKFGLSTNWRHPKPKPVLNPHALIQFCSPTAHCAGPIKGGINQVTARYSQNGANGAKTMSEAGTARNVPNWTRAFDNQICADFVQNFVST